jgi:formyltetrahydrofolate deformylase
MSVAMVISNHPDLADEVLPFGVPFLHVPAAKDSREQAEQRQLHLLRGNVDLVVLARYMQIITPRFLAEVGCAQGARSRPRRRDRALCHRAAR